MESNRNTEVGQEGPLGWVLAEEVGGPGRAGVL